MTSTREYIRRALNDPAAPQFQTVQLLLATAALVSVVVVVFEVIAPDATFFLIQWTTTVIFTVEYLARVWTARRKRAYILSRLGLIDLIAVLPTYLGLTSFTFLKAVRAVRTMRFLRILGMANTHKYFKKNKE